jgi:hypothetical protein
MKASGLLAGGALVALLLAGCGGDNSPSVSANSSSATTATGAASSNGSTATSSDGTGSTTTPSFKGDKNSDFCSYIKNVANSDFANSLGEDSTKLKDDLEKTQDVLSQAQSKAPSEIKADLGTVSSTIKQYQDLLAKYDYDVAKLTAAAQKDPKVLQQATDLFSDQKFAEASSRIEAYGQQVCGITPETSTTS